MRIRSEPLTPWQRKLLSLLMRRWAAMHGGVWPSGHRAARIRTALQKSIKWNYLGRQAAKYTRLRRDDVRLPKAPKHGAVADRIAKRHVLRILEEEQAGKWDERKRNVALIEAGLWEKKYVKK